jgi:CheY-like chemotaxis protein
MPPPSETIDPQAPNGAGARPAPRPEPSDGLRRFAGGVAHDLNNLLTPLLMAADAIQPQALAPADRELIRIITSGARHGADLVQQLQLIAAATDSPRREVSLAEVIAGVERLMRQTYPRNLQFAAVIPADLWWVRCDKALLHQALANLCASARDAMPAGGRIGITAANLEIDAETARREPGASPGKHVVVTVSDTGPGLTASDRDQLFEPYFVAKAERGRPGLGLATALGIVRGHGGFIRVRSGEETGTRFEVHLPSAGYAPKPETPDNPRLPLDGNDEVLLIVDDEATVRDSLREVLSRRHYRIVTAASGEEGLAILDREDPPIDVVMTDMMMPVMDGPAFIARARRLRPYLPIVAISGILEYRHKLAAYTDPPIHFLSKPFLIDVLLGGLRRALEGEPAPKG